MFQTISVTPAPEAFFVQIGLDGQLLYGSCIGCFAGVPFSADQDVKFIDDNRTRRDFANKFANLELQSFQTTRSPEMRIGLTKSHVDHKWPELIGIAKDYPDIPRYYKNHEMLAVAQMELVQSYEFKLRDQQQQINRLQQDLDGLKACIQ